MSEKHVRRKGVGVGLQTGTELNSPAFRRAYSKSAKFPMLILAVSQFKSLKQGVESTRLELDGNRILTSCQPHKVAFTVSG